LWWAAATAAIWWRSGNNFPFAQAESSTFRVVATTTVERPKSAGPDEGVGGNWMVIVLNDDHNTFDHVAKTLSSVIPGIALDGGYRFADKIHNRGQAAVWTGPREPAELYWEQLQQAGLTMAPLEQH
jgi:ATP-dependent Clp protease adaptor protein ClpS